MILATNRDISTISLIFSKNRMLQSQKLLPFTQIRPMTTAHLAQTMALLFLNASELEQKIESELARNPALEIDPGKRCSICGRIYPQKGSCPFCTKQKPASLGESIIFVSPVLYKGQQTGGSIEDDLPLDEVTPEFEDLSMYVMRQIALELPGEDRKLAAYLLANLNEDGLLMVEPVEAARYHHVPISRVESVIRLIQLADPIGVGSPTPKDALLIQLKVLAESMPIPEKAQEAIEMGMDLISRRQFSQLARKLRISHQHVLEICEFISRNLNPFPARANWGDVRTGKIKHPLVFTSPDIIISRSSSSDDDYLFVEIFSPYSGLLKINPLFRQSIQQAPEDKSNQWKSDIEQAELLVKCLQQRTNTMVRLVSRLTKIQREFILKGDGFLKPLTRVSLAHELSLHESTISRAVANKTAQLPDGRIIPLSRFFDRSLNVRTALRTIIEQETRPLSDSEIAVLLNHQGFNVARRTVAKYRSMEGILPSHQR